MPIISSSHSTLPLELYVPCLPPHLFFIIFTACCASLFPCSLCLDAQYQYCQNISACGTMNISYPFGVGKRGCGHPNFQINCVQNSSPVIQIHGQSYTILRLFSPKRFDIVRGENCKFFYRPNNNNNLPTPPSEHGDALFNISGKENRTLDVYKCNIPFQDAFDSTEGNLWKCNATVYYNFYSSGPIPGCSMEQVILEVGQTHFISNDTQRDKGCESCEASGGICGYNILDSTGPFLCYCKDGPRTHKCPGHGHGNKPSTIIGCSVAGVALTAIPLLLFLIFNAKKRKPPGGSTSKVEKFLKEYAYETPTRYSSSQLRKITNNFAEKLGEGGYGVVYKGKLRSNEALVAVKILDRHRHSEAQFMNEMATIGRVHHVNLVRLLGYCFESPISALVYEYMLNGSLDKFLFAWKEEREVLRQEQLYTIALGVARGIAYLHQDCDKRIIHFDIKPHNILLDVDFTPKIADFGLAKLCGKGDDHISMTAARGTPGYVAPEVCDSEMGPVTDKSDVYSYGMLLLEIVGGRKNIDVQVSRSSRLYFPEWAFKMLVSVELAIGAEGEIEAEDEEKAKRVMTKVGLWCIQYKSTDRPCMNRVVQMLEGNGDDVGHPPFPFNSSSPASELPSLPSIEIES